MVPGQRSRPRGGCREAPPRRSDAPPSWERQCRSRLANPPRGLAVGGSAMGSRAARWTVRLLRGDVGVFTAVAVSRRRRVEPSRYSRHAIAHIGLRPNAGRRKVARHDPLSGGDRNDAPPGLRHDARGRAGRRHDRVAPRHLRRAPEVARRMADGGSPPALRPSRRPCAGARGARRRSARPAVPAHPGDLPDPGPAPRLHVVHAGIAERPRRVGARPLRRDRDRRRVVEPDAPQLLQPERLQPDPRLGGGQLRRPGHHDPSVRQPG